MKRSLALLALLTACTPSITTFQPAETSKELRVETARYSHSVRFPAGAATLSDAERRGLIGFLDAVDLPAGETVTALSAPADGLAERRRGQINEVLARRGLRLSNLPTAAGTVVDRLAIGNEIVLVAERDVVRPPPCPDWSKPTGVDYGNTVGSNFGCATATNLGLMVANPRDLVIGRNPGPANIDRQVRLEQLFRERTPQAIWCDKGSSCGEGPKLQAPDPAQGDDKRAVAKSAKEG